MSSQEKSICKTTSGKIRRRTTRAELGDGNLKVVHDAVYEMTAADHDHNQTLLSDARVSASGSNSIASTVKAIEHASNGNGSTGPTLNGFHHSNGDSNGDSNSNGESSSVGSSVVNGEKQLSDAEYGSTTSSSADSSTDACAADHSHDGSTGTETEPDAERALTMRGLHQHANSGRGDAKGMLALALSREDRIVYLTQVLQTAAEQVRGDEVQLSDTRIVLSRPCTVRVLWSVKAHK